MKSRCENCRMGNYAQRKPESLIGRVWLWHTKWCPFWKAYQRELAAEEQRPVRDRPLAVDR